MTCFWIRRRLSTAGLAAMLAFGGVVDAQAQIRGNFNDADANHDGHVTLQEFEVYATSRLMAANGPMARRFKQLSPADQAARLQVRFDRLDRGHKGFLDQNDWNGS